MTTKTAQHTCPTCNGRRHITTTVANMQGPSKNRYQCAITPYVERHHFCATCQGTGRVDCQRCHDTGYMDTADPYGDYDIPMPCTCDRGFDVLEEIRAEAARVDNEAADLAAAAF